MRLEDKGRRNGAGLLREDDRKQDEEQMFAEIRPVVPRPDSQETYRRKLAYVTCQTFEIVAPGCRCHYHLEMCRKNLPDSFRSFVFVLGILINIRLFFFFSICSCFCH